MRTTVMIATFLHYYRIVLEDRLGWMRQRDLHRLHSNATMRVQPHKVRAVGNTQSVAGSRVCVCIDSKI